MSRDQHPELPEFPDLARRAAEDVSRPAFDDLLDRSRRRTNRRRAAIGAVAAVAMVAGIGAAIGLEHGPRAASPVGHPTASATASPGPPSVAQILAKGSLTSVAGNHGDLLAVRSLCRPNGTHCHGAWLLNSSAGSFAGPVPGSVPAAYSAGDDFVVSSFDHLGLVVHPNGSTAPLHRVKLLGRTPDAFIAGRQGWLAVDTGTATAGELPPIGEDTDIAAADVTDDGTVVALPETAGPARVRVATYANGQWSVQKVSTGDMPGYVRAGGDHVAALASTDGATVSPVSTLAVSTDGRDWTMLHRGDVPFDAVEAMAATDTGTLYVGTPQGLFRTTDDSWTRFTRASAKSVPLVGSIGDRVVVKTGADTYAGLDADGHSTDLGDLR